MASVNAEGQHQQTEVDALRGILQSQAIANAEAHETAQRAIDALRGKLTAIEEKGSAIKVSDFDDIFMQLEDVRVLVAPKNLDPTKPGSYSFENQQFAGKERNDAGELVASHGDGEASTGVTTDKSVIEAHGTDAMGVDSAR